MKLFLSLLLLVILNNLCAAAINPVGCESSANGTVNVTNDSSYESIGCSFSVFFAIHVDATLAKNATAVISLDEGSTDHGNRMGIGITCPSLSNAMGRILVTVKNTRFGQDAILKFTGSLPPHSSLLFSNNSFDLTQKNPNVDSINGVSPIAAIVIGHNSAPYLSLVNTTFIIADNTIRVTTATASFSTYCIAMPLANVTLRNRSALVIRSNAMAHSNVRGTMYFILWTYISSNSVTHTLVTDGSTLALTDNSIRASTFFSMVSVISVTLREPSLVVTNGSALDVSRNFILNSTISGATNVISWQSTGTSSIWTVANNSLILFNNNFLSRVNVLSSPAQVVIGLFGTSATFCIMNNSIMSMNSNRIVNATVQGETIVVLWRFASGSTSIAVNRNATLIANDNTIIQSQFGMNVNVVRWLFAGNLALSNRSAVGCSGNNISNASFADFEVVLWKCENFLVVSVAYDAKIALDRNTIGRSSSSGTGNVVSWDFVLGSHTFVITSRANITFDRNGIYESQLLSHTNVVDWPFASGTPSIIELGMGSLIAFNDNFVVNVSCEGNLYVAAWIFTSSPQLSLTANACIYMENNRIERSRLERVVYAVNWVMGSALAMVAINHQSSIQIRRNVILDSAIVSDVAAVYWDLNPTFTIANGSTVAFDGNMLRNISSRSSATVVYWSPCPSSTFTIINASHIYFNRNSIDTLTSVSCARGVEWAFKDATLRSEPLNISVTYNATVSFCNNSIQHAASLACIQVVLWTASNPNILIANGASVLAQNNNLRNSTSASLAYVVFWTFKGLTTVSISNMSDLSAEDNSLNTFSNINTFATIVYWYFQDGQALITVLNSSRIGMLNNSLESSSIGTNAGVIRWVMDSSLTSTFIVANSSTIAVNNNRILRGAVETTAAAFSWSSKLDLNVSITHNASITLVDNAVIGSTSKGVAYVAYLNSFQGGVVNIAVAYHSHMKIRAEVSNTEAASIVIGVYCPDIGSLILTQNATFSIFNSRISDTKGTDIYLSFITLKYRSELIGGSNMLFIQNNVTNISTTAVTLIQITMTHFVVQASQLVFRGNEMTIFAGPWQARMISIIASQANLVLTLAEGGVFAVENSNACLGRDLSLGSGSLLSLSIALTLFSQARLSITNNSVQVSFASAVPILDLASFSFKGIETQFQVRENNFTLVSITTCPPRVLSIGESSSTAGNTLLLLANNQISLQAKEKGALSCPFLAIGNMIDVPLVTIKENKVESNIPTHIEVLNVVMPSGGIMNIYHNIFHLSSPVVAGYLLLVSGVFVLDAGAQICIEMNMFDAVATFSNTPFKLINASLPTYVTSPSVKICGNEVFGDLSSSFIPDRYLHPPALVQISQACSTTRSDSIAHTSTLSLSHNSLSHSNSYSLPSPTNTLSQSKLSGSLSRSVVRTESESDTHSQSFASTPSHQPSASLTSYSLSQSLLLSTSLSHQGGTPSPRRISLSGNVTFTREINFTSPAPALIPIPAAVEVARQTREVASVAVIVTAVTSAVGGQLGVANAMMRLADCEDKDKPLPLLVHPLQFNFGDQQYQKNAAGAISNTIIVPLIITLIAVGPVRMLIMRVRDVSSRKALEQMGWPSLLIVPFSNLAEGIGVTTVASIMSGAPFGVALGAISGTIVLVFIGSWLWILMKIIPRSRLELTQVVQEDKPDKETKRAAVRKIMRPSRRWIPRENEINLSPRFVERYGNAIGDKTWFYADLLSFLCSLVVGTIENLPGSLCKERILIAMVPALAQCVLSVLTIVPMERFLQALLVVCLVPMYLLVAIQVFRGSSGDEVLEEVVSVLSGAGNMIGIGVTALNLIVGIWEMVTTHRNRGRHDPKSKEKKVNLADANASDLDIPMLEIEVKEEKEKVETPLSPRTREPEPFSPSETSRESNYVPLTAEIKPTPSLYRAPLLSPTSTRSFEDILDFVERAAMDQHLQSYQVD